MTATVYSRKVRVPSRLRHRKRPLPAPIQIAAVTILFFGAFFVINWAYHVFHKPAELLAPVSRSFLKTPEATWRSYGRLFEENSTNIIAPELLAALAQLESDGNPIALTAWRWQWSWNPFEIYRPVSSAIGMFQFTDGTFVIARKFCIREHEVRTAGPWYDLQSCWFNSLYTRTIPSHAIELTAAYLDKSVREATATLPRDKVANAQKRKLAGVIHLCGAARGKAFVKRGFKVLPGERCGSHSLSGYLDRVDRMTRRFARLQSG
jgi:hypothetical protein